MKRTLFVVFLLVNLPALDGQSVTSLVPGPNVNMVSGTTWPDGDPFLQRQNEPSMAVSSRNPQHLLGAANDYRSVDIPGILGADELGDVWQGIFRSLDGGQTWKSTLLPGCPYPIPQCDVTPASPLKGYQAAADPTVRAGSNGLFFVSGMAFNRGTNALGVIFLARYIDNNNKENGNPISYLGTSILDSGTSGQFLDKPWVLADIPRSGSGTCTVGGGTTGAPLQTFPSGNVYMTWSNFTGSSASPSSKIMFSRSLDCGVTWSNAQKLSESNAINQGTVLAVDPTSGAVYVAWRRILAGNQPDAILIAKSTDGGRSFGKAVTVATFGANVLFDQGKITSATGANQFRSKAFPALTVDGNGKVYLAWAQRGLLAGSNDSRIRVAISTDGTNWPTTTQYLGDPNPLRGHQFMPSLTFSGGTVLLAYYDARDDQTMSVYTPRPGSGGRYDETRVPIPGGNLDPAAGANYKPNLVFTDTIYDGTAGLKLKHTVDIRSVQIVAGPTPLFQPSIKVSQYKMGSVPGGNGKIRQLQFNPPNFPMFSKGTASFIGDYIDVATPTIVPLPGGGWGYNKSDPSKTFFQVVWTDNRDVRPPKAPATWADYTPPASVGGTSVYDTSQTRPICVPGQAGMRNQNIYTSQLLPGIAVVTSGAQKPINLSSKPRTFSVTVSNPNYTSRRYLLTIATPPSGTTASFDPGATPPPTTATVDAPPRSSVSRVVFVTSTTRNAQVSVNVSEVSVPGDAAFGFSGLTAAAIINPDIVNPDIVNPDIVNPDIVNPDIVSAEVFTPTISKAVTSPLLSAIANPDIVNPDIVNPDIVNPDIVNPDIVNPDIVNPDIVNPDIVNPDIVNPDIVNPDIVNPDIVNPDIVNPDIVAGYSDSVYTVKNVGNTATTYTVKLYKRDNTNICQPGCSATNTCQPGCVKMQMMLFRRYTTPTIGPLSSTNPKSACTLILQNQNPLVANIARPVFTPYESLSLPTSQAGSASPTIALDPGEQGQVAVRVFGRPSNFNINDVLNPVFISQGSNTTNSITPLTLLIKGMTPANAVLAANPANQAKYTGTVQIAGAVGATSWTVLPAAGYPLPADITLSQLPNNATTGTVTFTPTVAGLVLFQLQVTDNPVGGLSRIVTQTVQVNVVPELAGSGLTVSLPPATPGRPYNASLNVSGGLAPLTFTEVGSALAAAGLTLSSSGVISGTPNSSTGSSITFTVQVRDSSCLSASCTVTQTITLNLRIVVDSTGPVITPVISGTAGANSWYTSPVSLSWLVVDPESAVSSTSGCGPVNITDTPGSSFTCQATNTLGLPASVTTPAIKVDSTRPAITPSLTGSPGNGGWYSGPVTVSWNVTPNGPSGLGTTSGCTTTVLSADTAGTTLTCTASSLAGLSDSKSVTVKIDQSTPVVTPVVQGTAGAAGWYASAVAVSWNISSPLSGIGSSTGCAPTTLTATPAVGTVLTCTVTSTSGKVGTASVTIRIDGSAPQIVPAVTGKAGLNGWYTGPVSVVWQVTDPESGISSSTGCAGASLTADTIGVTVTCSATNSAGLSSSASVLVKIDQAPPVITITSPKAATTYLLNQVVTSSYTCVDAIAGPVACAPPAGSNIDTSSPGTKTYSVSATDPAGNTATVSQNYSVGYKFTGFGSPLAPAGTFSGNAGLGQAIPVKWTVQDSNNTLIGDLAAITSMWTNFTGAPVNNTCPIQPNSGAVFVLYSPTVGGTGGTELRATSSGFVFNWETSNHTSTGPGCYTLSLKLADGAVYSTSLLLM